MQPHSISKVVLASVVIFILALLYTLLFICIGTDDNRIAFIANDLAGISAILILYYGFSFDFSVLRKKPKFKNLLLFSILGIAIFLLDPILNIVSFVKGVVNSQIGSYALADHLPNSFNQPNFLSIYTVFRVVIIVPIYEEFIFRHYFISELKTKYKSWVAIVISSFLFGLFHLGLEKFVYAFIAGLLFGTLYHYKYSLWSIIYLHALINLAFTLYTVDYIPFNYATLFLLILALSIVSILLFKYVFTPQSKEEY